ncbi:uncharacterized protein METZ01_LOCUS335630 [marine metagenome]|uniref:Uncharacterized protein n=1 Tax=marine metagenome TaxID=408172 RepID=A0A382QBG6_9ZZZZ
MVVPDRSSTNERAVGTETRRNDPCPVGEGQTAPRLKSLASSVEKRGTETQSDRTSNHRQRKVQQVHHIPHPPTDHGPDPPSNLLAGIGGGCTGSHRDGCTRRHCLEATP